MIKIQLELLLGGDLKDRLKQEKTEAGQFNHSITSIQSSDCEI